MFRREFLATTLGALVAPFVAPKTINSVEMGVDYNLLIPEPLEVFEEECRVTTEQYFFLYSNMVYVNPRRLGVIRNIGE